VEVSHDEGVANRIGPAPCVDGREVGGEASAGESIGQPSSRERFNRSADAVWMAEGKTGTRVSASAYPAPRGRETLACGRSSSHGNREISGLTVSLEVARIGKAMSRSR
jgi:hypothetical protein